MTDDIALLDDSTRPEAPEFADLTAAQRAPGRHLAMIHGHFRHNMQLLRGLIEEAASGELPAKDLKARAEALPMLENYRRFGAICGQHCQIIHAHHSIEDEHIFPQIGAKNAAFKKVADRLIAEHGIVHALLVRLIDQLDDLVRMPGPSAFAAARETYGTLEKVLLSHFGYEEESIGDALGVFGIGV